MIRIVEDAVVSVVVLHRRAAVQDGSAQEQRKARRCRRIRNDIRGPLVRRVVLVLVYVGEGLRDDLAEIANRDLFFRFLVRFISNGATGSFMTEDFRKNLRWVDSWRNRSPRNPIAPATLSLNLICTNFDVVDEVIGEVYGRGKVIRSPHLAVDDKLEMVRSGTKVENRRHFPMFTVRWKELAFDR